MRLKCFLSLKCYIFYVRQFKVLWKFSDRLSLASYRLSYDRNVNIVIDEISKINLGERVHLRKGVDIEAHDGAILTIGDNFFINKNSSIISRYGIDIGNNCMIGENTTVVDHNHTFESADLPFKDQGYKGAKISIGNNVWIAGRVFIGQGVCIGDNVVIGSNTIITKSIPSNSVVYGKTELVIKPLENGMKE